VDAAKRGVGCRHFTADWANKKLLKLGVTELVSSINTYVISTDIAAAAELTVAATNRADALAEFNRRILSERLAVTAADAPYGRKFVSGPEDPEDRVPADDAPTTVDATLAALREVIMLAVIAGPHLQQYYADQTLAEFGLPLIPERKTFTVSRSARAELVTEVEAYDEDSALRVADWRWEDGRKGYTIGPALADGGAVAVEKTA